MGLPLAIEEGDSQIRDSREAPSGPRPMRYSSSSLKDLVCLCADPRNGDAWEELVSRVDKPISLAIIRTARPVLGRDPCGSLVEDLRQETYAKLLKDGCRLLRDCNINHEDQEILGYIKKAAHTVTLDHFKGQRSKKRGGDKPHISLTEVDLEAAKQADGSQERIDFRILLKEIDRHLKHCLTGADQKRDRMIFWLYFLQGMSCQEIASLPTIGLTDKGVGAVIDRLKHCLRERILRSRVDSEDDEG